MGCRRRRFRTLVNSCNRLGATMSPKNTETTLPPSLLKMMFRRRICDVFSSQIVGGKPRRVRCEEDSNKTVASFSLHGACFECVQASRHGVPCEPPTRCSMCKSAFTEDEAFRKAVIKAKRNRATATKKTKHSGSPPSHSDTSEPPSPFKSTYFVKAGEGC